MEFMLQNHVFPLFRSELGYMRARVSGVEATTLGSSNVLINVLSTCDHA